VLRYARTVAAAALIVAVAVTAWVLVRGSGSDYRVTAVFSNASLLVKGDQVKTGGVPVGTVKAIRLGARGQAEVDLRITDGEYAPLRRGTQALIRQTSLAGVANRYVDLQLPSVGTGPIPDGGLIPPADTLSAVELDQLFNTFDARTRRALQGLIQGSARALDGRGEDMRAGLLYLNPAVASSTRLLATLDGARPQLRAFLGSSARLAGDLASQREHVAGAVDGLAATMGAIDRRSRDLGDAVALAPATLRRANSTFVDLRSTLDGLEPLVRDARPLARLLPPFARDLRSVATSAPPSLRRLSALVRAGGADNDLVDLLHRLPALRDAATKPMQANGSERPPTLTSVTDAMKGLTPQVGFLRPYSVDLTGWFDDFGNSGVYDALGGMGRIAFHSLGYANVNGTLSYVPPALRPDVFDRVAQRGQRSRCPGSMERGAVWKPSPGFDCDPSQVPAGG
jgi:phospholipid/cholesterol/gamma-HCH transport system substrate-binding protein